MFNIRVLQNNLNVLLITSQVTKTIILVYNLCRSKLKYIKDKKHSLQKEFDRKSLKFL